MAMAIMAMVRQHVSLSSEFKLILEFLSWLTFAGRSSVRS